ncbi:MAG: hypothetical protein ABWX96_11965 [Propionibacteriaceae bacterium]
MGLNRQDPRLPFLILAAHTLIAAFTWRDVNRRDPADLRGPKWLWRLLSGLNTTGALAYYLVGRKSAGPFAR